MTQRENERNVLYGVLALHLHLISREALVAALCAWTGDKSRSLGQVLCQSGSLDAETLTLLEAVVARHLQAHGGDPKKSVAALGLSALFKELEEVADAEPHSARSIQSTVPPRDDAPSTRPPGMADDDAASTSASGPRYCIVRPHARGGLGQVYLARDRELNREVALKEIQERFADDPRARSRFLLEAEITGGLEHPGIVPVYGLGTYADGRPFYAMRFIQGDSLQEATARFHQQAASRDPSERRWACVSCSVAS